MPTRSRRRSSYQLPQTRAAYARTNRSFAVNDPAGFPSDYPPGTPGALWWIGSDQYPGVLNGPNDATAPSLAVVRRATALVVDPICQSPMTVQETGAFGAPVGVPTWLRDPMLCRPDGRILNLDSHFPVTLRLGRAKFWGDLLRASLWYGLGAMVFTEDVDGSPTAGSMMLIHPSQLSTTREGGDGSLRWVIGAGGSYDDQVVFDRNGYTTIGGIRYRIAILRNPASTVDAEGMSQGVFAMSPSAFHLERQIESYASGTFSSGVPSGYLKIETPNASPEMADTLRQNWLAHHGGDRRSIAVLASTVSFTPISLSPVDAALDQNKRLAIGDVAFAFGIDPNMLGAGLQNSASYNNVRDYFRQHRDFGIGIWISALQDMLTALIPGTAGVKVDTDAFTRPEPRERYESYAVAIASGVLTVNEARAIEGLPELPEPEPEPEPVPGPPELSAVPEQPAEEETTAEARERRPHPWRR